MWKTENSPKTSSPRSFPQLSWWWLSPQQARTYSWPPQGVLGRVSSCMPWEIPHTGFLLPTALLMSMYPDAQPLMWGIKMDGSISRHLLSNIFFPNVITSRAFLKSHIYLKEILSSYLETTAQTCHGSLSTPAPCGLPTSPWSWDCTCPWNIQLAVDVRHCWEGAL